MSIKIITKAKENSLNIKIVICKHDEADWLMIMAAMDKIVYLLIERGL